MSSYDGEDTERAYRRGWDQAIHHVMTSCGCSEEQIKKLRYKKRVASWRSGQGCYGYNMRKVPPSMDPLERIQFTSYLNSGFWDEQGDIADA